MNYIKRLEKENRELRARLKAGEELIGDFREFLTLPKFVGYESDGSRKDWISIGDLNARLDGFRSTLTTELF